MSQINDALNNPKELDKVKVMALIVHVADISHAAKEWSIHERYFNSLIHRGQRHPHKISSSQCLHHHTV